MRFFHPVILNSAFRTAFQSYNNVRKLNSIVKVINTKDDDCIRLTFKYSSSPKLLVKAPKDQNVQTVLNRIKLMVALQRKKEEIRQAVSNKYSATADGSIKTVEEDVDVHLYQNDDLLDESISNDRAWSQASVLKIGEILYEVNYNQPTVTELSLPEHIVAGCPLRPHFILECASLEDCIFKWFRSILSTNFCETNDSLDQRNFFMNDDSIWTQVGEDFIYYTTPEDVGCYIKIVCTPRHGSTAGLDFAVMSKRVVESGPDMYPFEIRQAYTKELCGPDSIRCLSYNILANMYVERKRFPYATKKACDIYYRKQLLLKELVGYKSDIICLQEATDRVFEYDLLPVLNCSDYQGIFTRKGGRRYEGVATFFRASKFKILKNYGGLLNEIVKQREIFNDLLAKVSGNLKDMSRLLAQGTAIQVILLEDIMNPHRRLLVANTHLYSNKDTPEVRLLQAALSACYVEHIIKSENLSSSGLLFCGDFNSLPDSEAYHFMTSGSFECCPTWKNNSTSNVDAVLRHNLCLDSACGTPEYTNYTEEFKGCLDYIFYSTKYLKVTDIVPMPSHEAVSAHVGLPNEYFPSDHIALVCTLKWIENT
ncbi:2',5'-phosphodiesterase 12-like [Uloborus diversus]|uniref:2',5'-phosphodiesterase 12-like n=1 Tax=Uloborus diversus TaxID=327109 RepID=UPI00240A070F|nr:2',5'-phosphodiesterase 12-like [Uloborus diversus]